MERSIYIVWIVLMMISTQACTQEQIRDIQWSTAFTLPADNMNEPHGGLAGPIVGVYKELLFIGGGANFPKKMPWDGGAKQYYHKLYVYDRSANQDKLLLIDTLPKPVAYGASCSTDEGIIVAGGENEKGLSPKVLLISWDEKAKKIETRALPDLPFALANASLVHVDGKLYFAGGEGVKNVSDDLLMFDLKHPNDGWKSLAKLPYEVSHACFIVCNKQLYLVGGRKRNTGGMSDFYRGGWRYDLLTNKWTALAPLPEPLSAGTALPLSNHLFWLFSGDNGQTFKKVESMIVQLAEEKDPARKSMLLAEKNELQVKHPGFGHKVWAYDTNKDEWTQKRDLPFDAPVTTTAVFWKNDIYLPSGEVKAGVRSPQVLKGKLVQ